MSEAKQFVPGTTTPVKASKGVFRESIESLGVALLIFLVVRTLAFQAFRIPTSSMEETLLPGDFLFVNKFAYGAQVPFTHHRLPGFTEPKVGDIIVFQFPENPSQDYIKRCVAVGGDTVEVKDKAVYVNGVKQDDSFTVHREPIIQRNPPRDQMEKIVVPENHLFMMGDNRDESYDSRYWGTVDMTLVRGKAWITYFSWDKEKKFPRFGRMFRLIK
ncbi:MAG: signal peptidase I [Candidatus Eisenbacteria bacterium]|uniref:Signal peptidase I n=1 Tax=Eiseniibacteriota bacterium TaxID=2212470 RepID=A0A956NAT4_UNCEI|nr:signal peptidase I [Candidatus Eisenbacteria bacterium]